VYEKEQSAVIGVQKVPPEDVKNYGMVAGQNTEDRLWRLSGLVEKPKPEDAPSNVAVVGRYILDGSIFKMLEEIQPDLGGEIQLTDAIAKQLQQESVYAYEFEGRRYDCGSKFGYLQATLEYGLKHPEVGAAFEAYLKKMDCFK